MNTGTQKLGNKNKVLIFGGAYGNLQATQAFFQFAEAAGFSADEILATGDLTAYCGQPNETLDLIRNKGCLSIWGNVEESLVERLADCGCNFETGSSCDLLSKHWYDFLLQTVRADHVSWMAELPQFIEFSMAGKKVVLVHGSPRQTQEFIFQASPLKCFQAAFENTQADIIVAGHSGIPFAKLLGKQKLWVNSGALGMPANDGTPRVWCCSIRVKSDQIHVQHHAVDYDFEETQRQMQKQKLPAAYIQTLQSGLWNDESILPEAQKNRAKKPLKLPAILFG